MSSEINVIVIIDRYLPIFGGAQNNVHELCRRLSDDGFKITILTRRIYSEMNKNEKLDNVDIKRVGYFPIRVISKVLCFLCILNYLITRKNHYNIVLCVPCVESTDLLPAYLASFVTKKPYVVRLTGFPTFDVKPLTTERTIWTRIMEVLLPKKYWLKIMRKASVVIAQSSVLSGVIEGYGVARCDIISNGVDFGRFHVADLQEKTLLREKLGIPNDKIIAVNTGRYDNDKNQITLLKAAESIEKNLLPEKLHVLIVGATQRNQLTSNEDQLKEYVKTNGLEGFVTFYDDVDNVEEYLKAADIFCHPTIDEGMSNALIEAMACGLPIICSDIPQEVCMFPEGEGLFHNPHDIGALINHLTTLISSDVLRESYGSMLSDYARENYSNEVLSLKYAKLFSGLVI